MANQFLTIAEVAKDFIEIIRQEAVKSLPEGASEQQILERQAAIMYGLQGTLGRFPPERKNHEEKEDDRGTSSNPCPLL